MHTSQHRSCHDTLTRITLRAYIRVTCKCKAIYYIYFLLVSRSKELTRHCRIFKHQGYIQNIKYPLNQNLPLEAVSSLSWPPTAFSPHPLEKKGGRGGGLIGFMRVAKKKCITFSTVTREPCGQNVEKPCCNPQMGNIWSACQKCPAETFCFGPQLIQAV